jgi:GWxTD domain-containing protein
MVVFERDGSNFTADFRVIVEVIDDHSKLVAREIRENQIQVDKFEKTNDKDQFLQDIINFHLDSGEYKVRVIISDLNSTGEKRLDPVDLELKEIKGELVFNPILIKSEEFICESKSEFLYANSGNQIPISSESFNLIIPIKDTSVTKLEINIRNNEEQIFEGIINDSYLVEMGMMKCEENIVITSVAGNILLRYFVLKNINNNLNEGEVTISVKSVEKEIDEEFNLKVFWPDKPFSLIEPEQAIELLSFIEPDSVVALMLDEDESEYQKVLFNYWKKFDPTPETSYNEIMFEYYNRVDYALKEFKGLGKLNGAKSDRGVIYIKFGKPESVERSSNPQGLIVETWTYLNPERKFSFIDKKGTGNFTLIEN